VLSSTPKYVNDTIVLASPVELTSSAKLLMDDYMIIIPQKTTMWKTSKTNAVPIATAKAAQLWYIAYAKGIGCGMLMSLATYQKTPLWVTVMAVATFILAGFNHCIADFYYMLVGGVFSWNLLLTILGNIVGGLFLSPQRLKSNI
jgi:formate/nitrite transporter FocA (FNT family)